MKNGLVALTLVIVASSCSSSRPDSDPIGIFVNGDSNPISQRLIELPEPFQTSASALAISSYQPRVDEYPVTVFVFSELDTYLTEQGLSGQAFLASPKLDDFVSTTMLMDQDIYTELYTEDIPTQQLQTLAGDMFTASNRVNIWDFTIEGNRPVDKFTFEVGAQEVTCIVHVIRTPNFVSASRCETTQPFVDFNW
ncbi:MAG: hypothetical protein AAF267_15325 [Deinococcota bacterium]